MPKMTKSKPKAIKKSNHRIFGIAFSALIIIALLAMIPLTLMSLKNETSTDDRGQAFTRGDNAYSIPSSSDRSWLQISTTPSSTYPQTRWESAQFTVPANQEVKFNVAALPLKYQGANNVQFTLVCAQDTPGTDNDCQNPIGVGGYSKLGAVIKNTGLTFHNNTAPLGKYKNHAKTMKFAQNTKMYVRINADSGTEVAVDFARVEKNDSSHSVLTPNGNFAQAETRNLQRNIPVIAENSNAAQFFMRIDKPFSTDYAGYLTATSLNNVENGMVIARTFDSDKKVPSDNLKYEYRFTPVNIGLHKIILRAKAAKMRDSNLTLHTRREKASNGAFTDETYHCNSVWSNVTQEFTDHVCEFNVTKLDDMYFYLAFQQPPGNEIHIDSISTIEPGGTELPGSRVDRFTVQSTNIPVKQPAQWTSGSGNFNDYMSRWTKKGEY